MKAEMKPEGKECGTSPMTFCEACGQKLKEKLKIYEISEIVVVSDGVLCNACWVSSDGCCCC